MPVSRSAPMASRLMPALDIGLASLAAAIWYVRPQEVATPLALLGVAWLLRWAVYGQPTRPTSLDYPLLLFLASAYLAAIFGFNQDQHWQTGVTPLMWAWGKYWAIVAALGLFYAIANLRSTDALWGVAGTLALLGMAVSGYFILTNDWSRGAKLDILGQVGALLSEPMPDVGGRRLHPNVAGGIIAIVLPFSLVRLWSARARIGAMSTWLAISLVSVVGLILAASRGAWLATAVVLLVWVVAHGYASARLGRSALRLVWLGLGALALGAVALAVADTGAMGGIPVAPIAGVPGFNAGVVLGRFTLWQSAIALGQDYAFTGAGLGAMPLTLSAYGLLVPVFYVTHAHNVLLNLWVEQGIAGVLLVLTLLALSGLAAAQYLRRAGRAAAWSDARSRLLVESACASMAILLLHGMVDDVPYGSRGLFLIFVPAALISAIVAGDRSARMRMREWRLVVLALVLCGVVAIWQRESLLASWFSNLGALQQSQAELTEYASPERLPEFMRRSANLDSAIANFERALAHDPANRTANQRLAMIALARAEYDSAVTYAEAALRSDPASATSHLLLADAYLAAGRDEEAYRLWAPIPNAAERVELTASLRYDKLNDRPRGEAARAFAARLRAQRAPRP